MLCLTNPNPISSVENNYTSNNNDISRAKKAINQLSTENVIDVVNDKVVSDSALSFKEEIQHFMTQHKNETDGVNKGNESLLALNSILLSKIIDKVDQPDKKLSSV